MKGDTLAAAFIDNAAGYSLAAEQANPEMIETRLHAASIAIELSLKAAILHRGGSDDENRKEIGHDLTRAWHVARAHGFEPSEEMAKAAARLTPFYRRHALAELARTIAASDVETLIAAVRQHVETVRRWMEAD